MLQFKWDEFIAIGLNLNEDIVNERIKSLAPNKCATLIYTVSIKY